MVFDFSVRYAYGSGVKLFRKCVVRALMDLYHLPGGNSSERWWAGWKESLRMQRVFCRQQEDVIRARSRELVMLFEMPVNARLFTSSQSLVWAWILHVVGKNAVEIQGCITDCHCKSISIYVNVLARLLHWLKIWLFYLASWHLMRIIILRKHKMFSQIAFLPGSIHWLVNTVTSRMGTVVNTTSLRQL